MNKVYFSTGSNLGDKSEYLQKAISQIELLIGKVIKKSSIYQSEPWGFNHENAFFNQVLICETELNPQDILRKIQEIENNNKRTRDGKEYNARTLDIDILFYNEVCINSIDLTIPHPLMHERKFVLLPLCEIDSDFIHPKNKKTMNQLLKECIDESEIERL